MAFHVACPITCQRICYCELGFPARLQGEKGRRAFVEEVARVEEFLRDPWCVRAAGGGGDGGTVQVLVPRIAQAALPAVVDDGGGVGEGEEAASLQTRRAAMQPQAAAATMATEDYAWKLDTVAFADASGETARDLTSEDQGSFTVKVICRICFSSENEGSDKAVKMLSCKICNKKYHRSCLKSWAENRDLFHWSSWACPSCRICEVCRRVGDPNKFMFCKRCDAAYHCYCQQPPHKNVGHGPYLCPKHTRCHSCGSSVPGSGLSTRWFLGYTCCDACGRLFVKGNYCPVCLKVYRDSESTPMVCCDACQRWVHCLCDGISDEKYQQFQADGNLYYKCAACRGDCYQVKDIDDAVQELWRRRDKADRDLIASLRAAAGLPFKEEIFSISPFSDDEESGPVILKSNHGRSLKFSVKGITDKITKSGNEYGKKSSKNSSSNKKYGKKKAYPAQLMGKTEEPYQNFKRQNEVRSLESSFGDEMIDDPKSYKIGGQEAISLPTTRSPGQNTVRSFIEQADDVKHSFSEEVTVDNVDKASMIESKRNKSYGFQLKEGTWKQGNKSEPVKGTKLVIHLTARNKNMTSSPRSEASSCHKEHDIPASNGSEASSQQKANDSEKYFIDVQDGIVRPNDGKGAKLDPVSLLKSSKHGDREVAVTKLGTASDMHIKIKEGGTSEECEPTSTGRTLILQKRSSEGHPAVETMDETTLGDDELMTRKNPKSMHVGPSGDGHDAAHEPSVSNSFPKDSKPLLKVKLKNPYLESHSSWVSQGEERNSVKGQRSKRKRPTLMEKVGLQEDVTYTHLHPGNSIDEVMDANWILQKLGKYAIGKRVEIHQPLDSSWHKGVVSDVIEGTTSLSVHLDDGGTKTLELGKQGIRFVSQKQKRTKL